MRSARSFNCQTKKQPRLFLFPCEKDLSQNDKFCGRSLFMAGRELKQLECGKVSVFGDSKADPVTKTGSNVDHILFAISYAI